MKYQTPIRLALSPCPNDTFMFYALIHKKVSVDLNIEVVYHDVQVLNEMADVETYDVTKLSCRKMVDVRDQYRMLRSGAAMGFGNGPLLVARPGGTSQAWKDQPIAVPGLDTTAVALLKHAYPEVQRLVPMLFSEVEGAILSGEVASGVLIHETRFMYAQRGLELLGDLGQIWEDRTQLPIPLGCIAASKSLPIEVAQGMTRAIADSIRYAWVHYDEVLPFMKSHAQELDSDIIRQHVEMFVNDMSLDIGEVGARAMQKLQSVLLAGEDASSEIQYV